MDLLSDVFKTANLQGRHIIKKSLSKETLLKFPCDKSIGFHILLHGEAELHFEKNKKVDIKSGDILLMARGVSHTIKNSKNKESVLLSGVYHLQHQPLHPFFSEISDFSKINFSDIKPHESIFEIIKILSEELSTNEIGSENIAHSLLDVLFNLILRKHIQAFSQSQIAHWSKAALDNKISESLKHMHEAPSYAWSLEELAHKVGMSRAGYALKFKNTLGETPLNYLTSLRLQIAMKLLTEKNEKLEVIANEVGYSDAFVFSKAFKKKLGLSPMEFRKQSKEVS